METLLTTSLPLIFGILAFLLAAIFFTLAETALVSSDRNLLRRMQKDGNRGAALALLLLKNIESLLTTTQFGMNLSIAAATTLATIYSIKLSGHENDWRVFILLTPLVLVFCDTLPKIVARARPERLASLVASPLFLVGSIFAPITGVLSLYAKNISRLFGAAAPDSITLRKRVRKQLLSLLSEKSSITGIKITQRRMIRNILNFSHQTVRKAMIPLVNVDAIDGSAPTEEVLKMFETTRHSRIPVYSERVDNIIGVLHFMDLFACENPEAKVSEYMRPAMFVPEHQQLEGIIVDMNSREESMAIVVDEYGGAIGIITKEDVLEEVVGNLADEFDERTLNLHQVSDSSFLANVNIEINDLNERLHVSLPKGDYETLSGFLLQQFNRIPSIGDELYYSDLKFLVYRANERAIQSVIITKLRKQKPERSPKGKK